ncbi:MAG: hypothetical protein K9N51_08975 [Candidatus Pacebacteria bacterium]|nr:hypothetical protein [Candidatus Paceibacterota bacterium]
MGDTRQRKTEFKWRKNAKGEHCIYDGAEPIAVFYGGTSELPENESAALRPISLHKLRLTPGGPVMIEEGEVCGPLCLSWRKHLMFNMEVDELTVDDADPERLTLFVRSKDTALRRDQDSSGYVPGGICEESWLEITYDAALQSYVYDLKTQVSIRPDSVEFVIARDLRGLEFGDLLPAGANDAFPPDGNKKYTHIVYRAADGKVYNRPQNKHLGPDKLDMFYAPDGFAAFVSEADGNPVVEFVDGTGARVRSEICWAMYDLHFKSRPEESRSALRAGKSLIFRYRLYSLPLRQAAALLGQSLPDPIIDHPVVRCPTFREDGVNDFAPSEDYRHPSDKWFWQCTDPACYWDWDDGCETPGVLTIHREQSAQGPSFPDAAWLDMYDLVSDGSRCSQWLYPRLAGNRDYRVTAQVRTENVQGNVYLALQWRLPKGEAGQMSLCPVKSEALNGTNDWTEITLNAACPGDSAGKQAGLFLVLEGTGKCWFDDVSIA